MTSIKLLERVEVGQKNIKIQIILNIGTLPQVMNILTSFSEYLKIRLYGEVIILVYHQIDVF